MPSTLFHTDQLTIIGPGLLGSSVALGLRQRGFSGKIAALARRQATLDLAQATGVYDHLTTDPAEAIGPATLVLIAVPLGGFRAVFTQIAKYGRPDLIITDVGSTKASVIEDARATLPDLSRVIGAHPMAGSEQAGPDAAQADLFVGKPCVMTVAPGDAPEAVALVESLWTALGANLLRMTPAEHDRRVALVSHLPHLAAVMLMDIASEHGGLDLASTGFHGATRLASSNPPMRADILQANRDEVRKAIAAMRRAYDQLDQMLADNDRAAIESLLTRAQADRAAWLTERDINATGTEEST